MHVKKAPSNALSTIPFLNDEAIRKLLVSTTNERVKYEFYDVPTYDCKWSEGKQK